MYEIIIVPFPITPLAALGYFVYQQSGLIAERVIIVPHWRPHSKYARKVRSDLVLRLFGGDLEARVREETGKTGNHTIHRLLNYVSRTNNKEVEELARLLARGHETPLEILRKAARRFAWISQMKRDPFTHGLSLPKPAASQQDLDQSKPLPKDTQVLTVPVFRTQKPGEREIVSWRQITLQEGRARILEGQHIAIAIGGPSGSGKSTAAVTLAVEMENLIRSLNSRVGWEGFSLSIQHVTLDLATPTTHAIAQGEGKDRDTLATLKVPWTTELALEAARSFADAKNTHSITIGDLPGGKIDEITQITAAPADIGIIITHDWEQVSLWQGLFAAIGAEVPARAKTRLKEEGFESIVTTYIPGAIFSGRISGLERLVQSWDPYLTALARVLLFDLLPNFIEKKKRTLAQVLMPS